MPAWCRPCAKCLRSRRSWGCRGFLPRVFGRRCLWRRWCSGRRRARPPARLGGLTSFGAVPRSPPVPSGPSGALHTGGAALLMCGWVRRIEARPGSAGLAVASNRSGCPCVARPCPAAAHRHRGQVPQASRRPPIGRGVRVLPGHALPPLTVTAAWPRVWRLARALGTLRRPPHQWGWVADVWLNASPRTPARSRSPSGRRDQTPSIPPASHPVVTSHIPEPTPNFACNSPTTLSNPEIGSLELQRFQTSLKLHSLELHASFLGSGRIDACWWRSRRA